VVSFMPLLLYCWRKSCQYPSYKIQMQQTLCQAGKARRFDFCGDFKMFLEDSAVVVQSIWFSDEENFSLSGCMNRQNMCVLGSRHLHNVMEMPLHPEKCMVWCALSTDDIVWPVSFNDTVTADSIYMSSKKKLFHFSKACVSVFAKHFFQQDGAWPLTLQLQCWICWMSILTSVV
jgi:hypothetical protein